MFQVRLVKFPTILEFKTFDDAIACAIRICAEANITKNGERYAVFHPGNGWHLV